MYWMLVYQALVHIENLCRDLQSDTIMKDVELVTLNTAETVFPRASLVYRHEMEEGNQDFLYSSGLNAKVLRLVYPEQINRFNNMVNSSHPSFWKFLLLFKREMDLTKNDMVHSNSNL